MAQPPKIRTNFSFRNVGDALDDIFIDAVNQLGNHLNVSIQNGLDEGVDIHGNPFEPLKPHSVELRGDSAPKPLLNRGLKSASNPRALRAVGIRKATTQKPMFRLEGKNTHGYWHNRGFKQTSPKQWYTGAVVPKREWFGLTKDVKPGGDQYKRMQLDIKLRIETKFTGRFRRF